MLALFQPSDILGIDEPRKLVEHVAELLFGGEKGGLGLPIQGADRLDGLPPGDGVERLGLLRFQASALHQDAGQLRLGRRGQDVPGMLGQELGQPLVGLVQEFLASGSRPPGMHRSINVSPAS